MTFNGSNKHYMRLKLNMQAALATAATALVSCDNKNLCFDHWDHAMRYSVDYRLSWQRDWEYPLEGGVDWQDNWDRHDFGMTYDFLRPSKPSGVRVRIYTDGYNNEQSNIPADGGIVNMTPGEHQILLYNNDTEYIVFNDITSLAQATATTRSRFRVTYIGNSAIEPREEENTVNPPDFLGVHYISSYRAEKTQVPTVVDVTMKPLVCRYLVRYYFAHGLEYVGVARGALAGMSGSVYLTGGHTGSDVVTVLYDCEVKPWGVETIVNTFGVPNYPNTDFSRSHGPYGLNVEMRLKNGCIINYDFDVTEQIVRQPRGGVIEVEGISIPDELGKEDTGSFDVNIDGWSEYEDINIDLSDK